jgi:hypothetical protein
MGKRRRQVRSDGGEPEVTLQNRIGSSAYECIRYPKPGMEPLDKAPHNENSEESREWNLLLLGLCPAPEFLRGVVSQRQLTRNQAHPISAYLRMCALDEDILLSKLSKPLFAESRFGARLCACWFSGLCFSAQRGSPNWPRADLKPRMKVRTSVQSL